MSWQQAWHQLYRAGLAFWLALGCASAAPVLPSGILAGDLIFRRGTEMVSAAVMALDGGDFTHVGMLVGSRGHWQVLHATPSEVRGRADGVVLDSLDFFLDAKRASRFALYHVDASVLQRRIALRAALSMLGRPFRIADPSGTYCTALIWDAWRTAGVDFQVSFSAINLPLLAGHYLLPSALLHSPRLRLIQPAMSLAVH